MDPMDLPHNRNDTTPNQAMEYDVNELHMPYNKNKKTFYRGKQQSQQMQYTDSIENAGRNGSNQHVQLSNFGLSSNEDHQSLKDQILEFSGNGERKSKSVLSRYLGINKG